MPGGCRQEPRVGVITACSSETASHRLRAGEWTASRRSMDAAPKLNGQTLEGVWLRGKATVRIDVDIIRAPEELPAESKERPAPVLTWILAFAFVAAAAAAAYITLRGPGQPASAPASRDRALPPDAAANLGGAAMPVVVPPLDLSDPVVRELVRQLTSHPQVAAWLATDGLIRNFTVVVANTADGATPARHLRALRPATAFSVDTTANGMVLDPLSYRQVRRDRVGNRLSRRRRSGAPIRHSQAAHCRSVPGPRSPGHPGGPGARTGAGRPARGSCRPGSHSSPSGERHRLCLRRSPSRVAHRCAEAPAANRSRQHESDTGLAPVDGPGPWHIRSTAPGSPHGRRDPLSSLALHHRGS